MIRTEFLRKIEYGIRGLNHSDKINVVKYYDELISDKVEVMGSESKAIESFGPIDRIILDILSEYKIEPQKKANVKGANIIVTILLFPLWICLLACLLCLFVGLWTVVFAIGITSIALFITGVFGILVTIFTLYEGIAYSLLVFGTCLVSIGLSIVFAMLVGVLSKNLAKFTKLCSVGIKNAFVRSASL